MPLALLRLRGWDTVQNQAYLTEMIQEFQRNGIRTSIFVDPRLDMIEGAKKQVPIELNCTRSLCASIRSR
jgi:pyridoxine 5'-phosphate synthase PdxJ